MSRPQPGSSSREPGVGPMSGVCAGARLHMPDPPPVSHSAGQRAK
jgi:hypothetical protein